MADEPDIYGIDPRDWPDVVDMLHWWRALRDSGGGEGSPRSYHGELFMAVAVDDIDPGDTGTIQFVDENWAPMSPAREAEAKNDSDVPVKADDRLWLVRKKREWRILRFGGGGAEITFQVYDVVGDVTINGQDYRAAWCDVKAKSCGSDIHGADDNGRVLVIDVLGCLFNEPDEDLEPTGDHGGRMGVASWQELLDDPDHECRYVATALCCPPELI